MEQRQRDAADLLAQLAALVARVEAQEAQIARLRQTVATVPPAVPGLPTEKRVKVGRRGLLAKVAGATAVAALLTVATEAAPTVAETRTTIRAGSASTGQYGLAAIVSANDPANFLPTDTSKTHGVIGLDSAQFTGTIPYHSGVLGTSVIASAAGVQGLNPAGPGVIGQSSSYFGVHGTSSTYAGVGGVSSSQFGVWGQSGSNIGVYGESSGASGYGLFGRVHNAAAGATGVYGEVEGAGAAGIGVHGRSGSGTGVKGAAPFGSGVWGTSSTAYGVLGQSGSGAGVFGDSSTAGGYGVYGRSTSGAAIFGVTTNGYAGSFSGPVVVQGSFTVFGGPKSAAVPHPDGSQRRMYCQESPEPWFEDFGEAKLAGGKAEIKLDPDFAAVVRNDKYLIFLTEIGDAGGLFISAQTSTGFTIEARNPKTMVSCYYRVAAKRRDIAGPRLEKVDLPRAAPAIKLPDPFKPDEQAPTQPPPSGR